MSYGTSDTNAADVQRQLDRAERVAAQDRADAAQRAAQTARVNSR